MVEREATLSTPKKPSGWESEDPGYKPRGLQANFDPRS